MNINIIKLLVLFTSILRIKSDSSSSGCTDCANGWKIITDVFYCQSIFGNANCANDQACLSDFYNYKACAFTGCFGEMHNLSSISDYNSCVAKCVATSKPVIDFAKSFSNCMNVASSMKLLFNIVATFLLYCIYF